jgi:hypothetical protein
MLTSHIVSVMQQDKQGRFVPAKVRQKYNKAKIKRFGADSTIDNELANEKLHTLDELDVVDRRLCELFWPPIFLHAE